MWIPFLLSFILFLILIFQGEDGNLIQEAMQEYRGYENIGTGSRKRTIKLGQMLTRLIRLAHFFVE